MQSEVRAETKNLTPRELFNWLCALLSVVIQSCNLLGVRDNKLLNFKMLDLFERNEKDDSIMRVEDWIKPRYPLSDKDLSSRSANDPEDPALILTAIAVAVVFVCFPKFEKEVKARQQDDMRLKTAAGKSGDNNYFQITFYMIQVLFFDWSRNMTHSTNELNKVAHSPLDWDGSAEQLKAALLRADSATSEFMMLTHNISRNDIHRVTESLTKLELMLMKYGGAQFSLLLSQVQELANEQSNDYYTFVALAASLIGRDFVASGVSAPQVAAMAATVPATQPAARSAQRSAQPAQQPAAQLAAQPAQPAQQPAARPEKVQCNLCFLVGHAADVCSKAKDPAGYTCPLCHTLGHLPAACPSKSVQEKLEYAKLKLNGGGRGGSGYGGGRGRGGGRGGGRGSGGRRRPFQGGGCQCFAAPGSVRHSQRRCVSNCTRPAAWAVRGRLLGRCRVLKRSRWKAVDDPHRGSRHGHIPRRKELGHMP